MNSKGKCTKNSGVIAGERVVRAVRTWTERDDRIHLKRFFFYHREEISFAGRSSSHHTHQRNWVEGPGPTTTSLTPWWVTFQNILGLPTWIITFFQAKPGLAASPSPFPDHPPPTHTHTHTLPKSGWEHGSENKWEASWVCSLLH